MKRRVVEVGTRGTRRAKTEGGEAPWQGRGRGGGGRRAREKSVSFSFFRLSLSSSPAPFSLSLSLLPRRLYSQQLGISQATLDIVFAASRVSFSLEILSAPRRAPPSVPILLLLSLSISRECRGCRARETRSSFEFTPKNRGNPCHEAQRPFLAPLSLVPLNASSFHPSTNRTRDEGQGGIIVSVQGICRFLQSSRIYINEFSRCHTSHIADNLAFDRVTYTRIVYNSILSPCLDSYILVFLKSITLKYK